MLPPIRHFQTNLGFLQKQQPGISFSASASSPNNQASFPLCPNQATALKHQILFGLRTTQPITYRHLKTIDDPIVGQIQVYRFSNGMEFYGVQRDELPLVAYGELIKTGSANETKRTNGASHYLEHLIFKGTKNIRPGEADQILDGLGASINASTRTDGTFYYVYNMPRESLGTAIEIWTELLSAPELAQSEVERERPVIAEELRQINQNPVNQLISQLEEQVWPTSRAKWPTGGPLSNILSEPSKRGKTHHLQPAEIRRFFEHFYDPSNRAIVVVGDFDLKSTLEKVAHEHGSRPFQGKKHFKLLPPLYPGAVPTETVRRADVQTATLYLGFNGPSRNTPNSEKKIAALELLADILGSGSSSRLIKALVAQPNRKRLANEISAGNSIHKSDNLLYIYADSKPENLASLKQAIRHTIEDIAQNGVTPEELAKAQKLEKRFLADRTENQAGLLRELALAIEQERADVSFNNRLKIFAQITPQDIQQVAQEYLHADAQRAAILLPQEAEKTKAVPVRFAGSLSSKDKTTRLPGGTEVVVREKTGALKTAIVFTIPGGHRLDSTPGESIMLADMIRCGTQAWYGAEMAEYMEQDGISFKTESDGHQIRLIFSSLSEDRSNLLGWIGEIMQPPAFRDGDLKYIKEMIQAIYLRELDQTPKLKAQEMLTNRLYGETHPYGYNRCNHRLLDNLKDISPATLRAAYAHRFIQTNITISAVGDISLDELADRSREWLEPFPKNTIDVPAHPVKPIAKNSIMTQSQEGLHQAEIYRVWKAPDIDAPDRIPMMVLETILKGSRGRLFRTFRENQEKALCYTVAPGFVARKDGGDFYLYIGTQPGNIRRVTRLLQEEMDKLMREPVSINEITRAKLKLKSAILSEQQDTVGIASELGRHRALDLDSSEDLLPKIDQVTPEQIQKVAYRYFRKPSLTAVLAPASGLKKAGLPVNGELPVAY